MPLTSGQLAEQKAAQYLAENGYHILQKNWRTRRCEIDIVAQKNNTIYMVEVKYRLTHRQGEGFEYITPRKLLQMTFAAQSWVHYHAWNGSYQLAVISVSGEAYDVTDFILDL